jgi:LAO/AO transport system kinase
MSSAQERARLLALKKRQDARNKSNDVEGLAKAILSGNTVALSQGITLVESTQKADRAQANKLIEACLHHKNKSFRLGITGVPGVGKSSFIEQFGLQLIASGHKVAVLAIDPSSGINKGSILGDKTRMNDLSTHPKAFIRPSPASDALGGVANKTREALLLCEAAGYDYIIVETVGVGQSETAVKNMTDFFLLLMLSGAGDELQGIKRGIMEMADGLVITKADGDNKTPAKLAAQEYRRALHLFPPNKNNWPVHISTCSSLDKVGLDIIENALTSFHEEQSNFITNNRGEQNKKWFIDQLEQLWQEKLYQNINSEDLRKYQLMAEENKGNPFKMAEELIQSTQQK